MSSPAEIDPAELAARRLLLDVLDQLGTAKDQVILVGAQAVRVHIAVTSSPVVLATFDADLSLDPRNPPMIDIADALERAGLRLQEKDGAPQPGVWVPVSAGQGTMLSIDLLVPAAFSARPARRAADLEGQRSGSARYAKGLEASTVNRQRRRIDSLNPAEQRSIVAPVAGPSALIIAKLHKVADRTANVRRPDRVHAKDFYEIYRLLQLPEDQLVTGWSAAVGDTVARETSLQAIDLLEGFFVRKGGVGPDLAAEHVSAFEAGDQIRDSARVLAAELLGTLRSRT